MYSIWEYLGVKSKNMWGQILGLQIGEESLKVLELGLAQVSSCHHLPAYEPGQEPQVFPSVKWSNHSTYFLEQL